MTNNVKKIIILGHFGVGKSSLLRKYIYNKFSDNYDATIGVTIKKKDIIFNNIPIKLIIWDIEGNDDIYKLRTSYMMGSSAFIYVFDTSRISTYINIKKEIDYLSTILPSAARVLLGNKIDLIDKFELDQIKNNLSFTNTFYISLKEIESIDFIFEEILKLQNV